MRLVLLIALASCQLLAQAAQPDPLMLERNHALQLADQGHESEALGMLLGIIKRAPLFQPAYSYLEAIAVRAGKRAETLETLRSLVRSGPKFAGAWLGVADLLMDPSAKVDAQLRCVRDVPDAWMCFEGIAWQVKQLHHGKLEISGFEQILGRPPTSLNDHIALADVHLHNGRVQQAIQELNRALAADGDLPRTAYLERKLGEDCARSPGGWSSAAPHFQRAVELERAAQDCTGVIGALSDGATTVKGEQGTAMYQKAIELARDYEMRSSEAGVLYSFARHLENEGRLVPAR